MTGPYQKEYTEFTKESVRGSRMITRQEFTTYEWRNDTLFKIITTRQFMKGGSDYHDSQTVIPVYAE